MRSPPVLVLVLVLVPLAAVGCGPSIGESGSGERPALADAVEAAAFAELLTMHGATPRAAAVARTRLEAMEADPGRVDAVDRAAVRFLQAFAPLEAPGGFDEAMWFLGERGFEPDDEATPRRPEAEADVKAEALAHFAAETWPPGPVRHVLGRVRWVSGDTVKVESTSQRVGSSCAYGRVLVLRTQGGRWSVVRTIRTWVS